MSTDLNYQIPRLFLVSLKMTKLVFLKILVELSARTKWLPTVWVVRVAFFFPLLPQKKKNNNNNNKRTGVVRANRGTSGVQRKVKVAERHARLFLRPFAGIALL